MTKNEIKSNFFISTCSLGMKKPSWIYSNLIQKAHLYFSRLLLKGKPIQTTWQKSAAGKTKGEKWRALGNRTRDTGDRKCGTEKVYNNKSKRRQKSRVSWLTAIPSTRSQSKHIEYKYKVPYIKSSCPDCFITPNSAYLTKQYTCVHCHTLWIPLLRP